MSNHQLSFRDKLNNYLNASYPMLWVQTHEENRVVTEIVEAFRDPPATSTGGMRQRTIYEWDSIRGMTKMELNKTRTAIAETVAVKKLLEFIEKASSSRQLFLLKDFHPFLQEPVVKRALRNLTGKLKATNTAIIFISPLCTIPEELIKEVQILDFALPDAARLKDRLEFIHRAAESSKTTSSGPKDFNISPEIELKAIEAAKGLTDSEAENAYTLALVENKKFDDGFVATVFSEKVAQVKKNGLLTYLEPDMSFDQVGGLEGLKTWIKQRALAYTPAARTYGLAHARGMLLCGIPGCGKTLLAKATSRELKLPLFQLDVGGLFSKFVGDTEQNFRKVIQIIDGIGSCILFID